MALFTKREPCAICGGKVKALMPWRVDGQLVCNSCYGTVHVSDEIRKNWSMDTFRGYLAFREQNDVLRQSFQETRKVSFGWLDDKVVFDIPKRLFCMKADLDSTIFEGRNIKSFVIREDTNIIFEGSAAGLQRCNSTVTERIVALTPLIRQWARHEEMMRRANDNDSGKAKISYSGDFQRVAEPFEKFVVEIYLDHPYWDVLRMEKTGPKFNDSYPDADAYLRSYRDDAASMDELARALMEVAFPNAASVRTGGNGAVFMGQAVAAAAPVDAVAEIQRYKTLMDQGLITEEEFTAKKRQLLGI